MYTTAKDKEEYFHLLSERCYKIYKELEEVRRRRKSAGSVPASNSSATSSLPNDSGTSSNRGVSSSSNAPFPGHPADPQGPNHLKLSLANCQPEARPSSSSSLPEVKPEGCTPAAGSVKKEEDERYPDATASSQRFHPPASVKPEESNQPTEPITFDAQSGGGNIASPSGSSTDAIKVDESKWKKWSREELLRHFLRLHEEIYADPNAHWFRDPVDPVALDIPDYPEKIKHPMDLTTIRNNLEDGVYKDPWEVLDHFRLMFNNAWLYNKKNSKVYKMCTKVCFYFAFKASL